MTDFDGWSPIYPYANLRNSNNLRNILRRGNAKLLEPASYKHKEYDPERMNDTRLKAIDVEAVIGYDGEKIPIEVSLVNYYGYPLIDTYVHPFASVRNWVTHVTGFDQNSWNNMVNEGNSRVCTYRQVMDNIAQYLDEDDSLVGHNINSDIEFLGLNTNGVYVIDTQTKYPYNDNLPRKPGLARVLRRYFNLTIQDGSHDTLEDARGSLLIYRSLLE